jgi:Mrp family chromosome partitioning ATPase
MSKIESALAKARARGMQLASSAGTRRAGTDLVPAQGRSLADRQSREAAAAVALRKMEEPWLLDKQDLAERQIIYPGMVDARAAMAFRDLRTKILQAARENCTIMVTSCAKGRDSGMIATNLAVSFSLDDSKTAVLVNCDLGAPFIDRLVPSADERGITDYLRSESVRLEQIIHPVGLPRLRVIPAGKTQDHMAEYFTLAKMSQLLSELRARHADRYVVMNAPPIYDSADTRVLVELADYVVLVVPYGCVTESQVTNAAKMIGDKKLLGAVFSDMPSLPGGRRGVLGWLARLAGVGLVPSRNMSISGKS